ncbi:MAG: hypothetical protein JSU65_00160 [Candidatus Zixiibacteriota bacterium]|nr:MAG: hypothetical protein JSU65_00160 [candidate division Zixibacteria bacterium]
MLGVIYSAISAGLRSVLSCSCVLLSVWLAADSARGFDLAMNAATDLRVMYLFEDEESIDWPTLYYLNEEQYCRIDLVTFGAGVGYDSRSEEIADREIYLHRFYPDPDDSTALDSVLASLFRVRRPDIVLIGPALGKQYLQLEERLLGLPNDSQSLFNITKIYRLTGLRNEDSTSLGSVVINPQELWTRFRGRIELEVPQLFPWFHHGIQEPARLRRYELIQSGLPIGRLDPDFTSGLPACRLTRVMDSVLIEGLLKDSFIGRARNFLTFFGFSRNTVGSERVDKLMQGFRAIMALEHQAQSESRLMAVPGFADYLGRLRDRAQRAVLHAVGLTWEGKVILRDSPHGPKLKFRAALSVNGPEPVELSYLRFHPYWDTVAVTVDSASRLIKPHQSFVREYLIDIDRARLEAKMPESLLFTAEIVYGRIPLEMLSSLPVWEAPNLNIHFEPDYHFIQPFARLNVDRVVASMNWKAVISKPKHFYGTVKLDLTTPRGVFAGAYRQEIQLEKGRVRETVRIPFSVSNLFELGVQQQVLNLLVDGHQVASDTGIIRIASCHIEDTIHVGFLPDSTGQLEDILRMTDASFRPLTDRTLLTGDLDAYNVILIGSGALRQFPSFGQIKGRIEEYVRQGGSLVVLGQPGDWPEGALPVALSPSRETLMSSDILNRIDGATILSKPHKIDEDDLFSGLPGRRVFAAAVVAPAERVYVTPSSATLLSVSRIGTGQIIFCGLPLVEMVGDLNLEAIHLVANILNY